MIFLVALFCNSKAMSIICFALTNVEQCKQKWFGRSISDAKIDDSLIENDDEEDEERHPLEGAVAPPAAKPPSFVGVFRSLSFSETLGRNRQGKKQEENAIKRAFVIFSVAFYTPQGS